MSDPTAQTWTVLALLNWTKGYLAKADVGAPRLAAEVLLAHVLDCSRIDLYARYDYPPSPEELEAYRDLVRRAAAHEPVAYLVGHKEFYSLPFRVTPDVLIPRPETELLVAEAVAHLRARPDARWVWDACTGCGCVAVAVAANVIEADVLATDVSAPAVALTRENADANDVGPRVRTAVADLLARPAGVPDLPERFDVITGNPPYVADDAEVGEEVRFEPALALRAGPDGLDRLRPLIAAAPEQLAPGGALILEFGYDQADAVRDLICGTGRFAEPRILRDQAAIERAAVAVRK